MRVEFENGSGQLKNMAAGGGGSFPYLAIENWAVLFLTISISSKLLGGDTISLFPRASNSASAASNSFLAHSSNNFACKSAFALYCPLIFWYLVLHFLQLELIPLALGKFCRVIQEEVKPIVHAGQYYSPA
ncbi:hypothetical protein DPMN_059761 [Dreissena polymorpha]|uniref:Uncharacterized protein n=1 Tax=Dreissena polymorpha TaxID=45954 RepID=A0A9D4C4K6_DREPO|nr:hypothetical protein DPMN_059761 [Dreissena polymorpha]